MIALCNFSVTCLIARCCRFASQLPDMKFVVNNMDEPRVLPNVAEVGDTDDIDKRMASSLCSEASPSFKKHRHLHGFINNRYTFQSNDILIRMIITIMLQSNGNATTIVHTDKTWPTIQCGVQEMNLQLSVIWSQFSFFVGFFMIFIFQFREPHRTHGLNCCLNMNSIALSAWVWFSVLSLALFGVNMCSRPAFFEIKPSIQHDIVSDLLPTSAESSIILVLAFSNMRSCAVVAEIDRANCAWCGNVGMNVFIIAPGRLQHCCQYIIWAKDLKVPQLYMIESFYTIENSSSNDCLNIWCRIDIVCGQTFMQCLP